VRTSEFDYDLPPELIAQEPAEPRDSARLLDCRDLSDHRFSDLPDLLEPGDLLVVNRTRVRRARLRGRRRDTGGAIELLLLDGSGASWTALSRPARRLRPGIIIDVGGLQATVTSPARDGVIAIELSADQASIDDAIESEGELPLPPYLDGGLGDDERYQTIFATEAVSSAAPTAGLHFTTDLVSRLAARQIDIARIHLQVGLDTFRPISSDVIEDHRIHSEPVEVDQSTADAIAATRSRGGRIVAVGTTVTRALESAADDRGGVVATSGPTDLFIMPGYHFRVVDGLITNFHVPASSLVVMVAAFMGDRWRGAYQAAVTRGYRMLSFGDAMLVFR
jgi:S-adenosylmethionine:tRNA ribosyltransferase-isomerase